MNIVPQPDWKDRLTPNLSERRGKIQGIVLHHTAGRYPGDLNTLTSAKSRVSADFYLSAKNGLFKLNPQLQRWKTWHAGMSFWADHGGFLVNDNTIGIEMEFDPRRDEWSPGMVEDCAHLVAWLIQRYKLDVNNGVVASHRKVALPPGRKIDPLGFPWNDFSISVRERLGVA